MQVLVIGSKVKNMEGGIGCFAVIVTVSVQRDGHFLSIQSVCEGKSLLIVINSCINSNLKQKRQS